MTIAINFETSADENSAVMQDIFISVLIKVPLYLGLVAHIQPRCVIRRKPIRELQNLL